jgi:hypothetical protein
LHGKPCFIGQIISFGAALSPRRNNSQKFVICVFLVVETRGRRVACSYDNSFFKEPRMKKTLLAAAIVATTALSLGSTLANADDKKRGDKKHVYVSINAPGYRHAPPAYYHGGYRPYHRPHYNHSNHSYHHPRHGHWRDGRWIAPVVVGATIGALAVSASTPVHAAPAPVYYDAPVNYYTPGDRFSWADVNNDGYLSYHEARRYGNLYRNFGRVDWSGDGYLSREEVNAWRYHW